MRWNFFTLYMERRFFSFLFLFLIVFFTPEFLIQDTWAGMRDKRTRAGGLAGLFLYLVGGGQALGGRGNGVNFHSKDSLHLLVFCFLLGGFPQRVVFLALFFFLGFFGALFS
jgi:hypothetical protein